MEAVASPCIRSADCGLVGGAIRLINGNLLGRDGRDKAHEFRFYDEPLFARAVAQPISASSFATVGNNGVSKIVDCLDTDRVTDLHRQGRRFARIVLEHCQRLLRRTCLAAPKYDCPCIKLVLKSVEQCRQILEASSLIAVPLSIAESSETSVPIRSTDQANLASKAIT